MTATETVLAVAATLLGAIVGSFLNVVVHRLPAGTFFSDGMRSVCANSQCKQPIPAYLNVPILGWLLLRGRARCCGQPISVRYPLVEALTAALFLLLWLYPPYRTAVVGNEIDAAGLASFVFFAFFAANLVANSFIDIDYRILPDVLTKSAIAVGLVGSLVVPGLAGRFDLVGLSPASDSLLFSAAGSVVGFGLMQAIRKAAQLVFRRDAMGFGDVKLMAGIGAFVGPFDVILTFFVGCVLGAVVGVVHRWLTKDAYICFGPFLAAGALVTLFAGSSLREGFEEWQRWQQANASAPWVAVVGVVVSTVLLVVLVRRGRG